MMFCSVILEICIDLGDFQLHMVFCSVIYENFIISNGVL